MNLLSYGIPISMYALLNAARSGKAPVQEFLQQRTDLSIDNGGYRDASPLHCAIEEGDLVAVRTLLECGAHVNVKNARGETPLYCAIKRNEVFIIQLLLSVSGVEIGSEVLKLRMQPAIKERVMRTLVRRHTEQAWWRAVRSCDVPAMREHLEAWRAMHPHGLVELEIVAFDLACFFAIARGKADMLHILLAAGAQPNGWQFGYPLLLVPFVVDPENERDRVAVLRELLRSPNIDVDEDVLRAIQNDSSVRNDFKSAIVNLPELNHNVRDLIECEIRLGYWFPEFLRSAIKTVSEDLCMVCKDIVSSYRHEPKENEDECSQSAVEDEWWYAVWELNADAMQEHFESWRRNHGKGWSELEKTVLYFAPYQALAYNNMGVLPLLFDAGAELNACYDGLSLLSVPFIMPWSTDNDQAPILREILKRAKAEDQAIIDSSLLDWIKTKSRVRDTVKRALIDLPEINPSIRDVLENAIRQAENSEVPLHTVSPTIGLIPHIKTMLQHGLALPGWSIIQPLT